jgi:uridine kinase
MRTSDPPGGGAAEPRPLARRPPLVAGIAGGSGSGKTTLATGLLTLCEPFRPVHISQDDYYRGLPAGVAAPDYNFDEPAALDLAALAADLLALKAGRTILAPRYDFASHRPQPDRVEVRPAPLIVVEGLFLYAEPALRDAIDLRFFVDVPDGERLRRRIARDTAERGRTEAEIRGQFERQVRPMHDLHVQPGRAHAHVVLDIPHPDDMAYCEQVIDMWRRVEQRLQTPP